jgi:hypothetical protein
MSLLTLLLGAAAASAPAFNAGTDRGVFVYDYLVLDFQRGQEVMGRSHALRNCSTDTLYCADGELFNIVLPRFCRDIEIRPGTVWRQGELQTTVIGRENIDVVGHAPAGTNYQLYYLHTNVRPDIVYAYSPNRGVIRLYYDLRREVRPGEAVDFVEIARRGELEAFSRTADARRRNLSLGLLTLDQFAACLPEELRNRQNAGGPPRGFAQ